MEQIRHANIPLRLKNVKNPGGRGTIIYPSQDYGKVVVPITPPHSGSSSPTSPNPQPGTLSFMNANGYYGNSCHRRAPTALTSKDSIVLVNIQSNRRTKSHGFLAQIFQSLDERNVVVDLITSSEQNVSLALEAFDNVMDLQRLQKNLEKCGTVSVLPNMSIVSVIGHKMRNMVGINGESLTSRRMSNDSYKMQARYFLSLLVAVSTYILSAKEPVRLMSRKFFNNTLPSGSAHRKIAS
jgi:aspartate kinase